MQWWRVARACQLGLSELVSFLLHSFQASGEEAANRVSPPVVVVRRVKEWEGGREGGREGGSVVRAGGSGVE